MHPDWDKEAKEEDIMPEEDDSQIMAMLGL